MKKIPLTRHACAFVDDCDYEMLVAHRWYAHVHIHDKNLVYARRTAYENGRQRTVLMHREILGDIPPGMVVDHIDHNTTNNTRANLRIVAQPQNSRNRRGAQRDSLSGTRGVSPSNGKWRATIKVCGKVIHLGRFSEIKDAAFAYAAANKKYFGEFGGL